MQCQIKNLPVFRRWRTVLRNAFPAKICGISSAEFAASSSADPHDPKIDRGEFVPVVLKEFFKSGIRQFDRALPVKNHDPQRAILYQRDPNTWFVHSDQWPGGAAR